MSVTAFTEAEKLARFPLTADERRQAAGDWRSSMAPVHEGARGRAKFALDPATAPASRWDPLLPGQHAAAARDRFIRSTPGVGAVPADDREIPFAPLWRLSCWIESRRLTSGRLTRIDLDRMERFDTNRELTQAAQAGREIAAGAYRGRLHGIPRGAKDWWTRRASPPRRARSRIAIACRRGMRR